MKKTAALCILFSLVVVIVFAADEGPREPKPITGIQQRPEAMPENAVARPSRTDMPGPRGSSMNRGQRYQQMKARQAESHAKAIAELVAIQKIAEEEGAMRTKMALQEMINKKNAGFMQSVERIESQLRARTEGRGSQQRPGQGTQRPTPAPVDKKPEAAAPKEASAEEK